MGVLTSAWNAAGKLNFDLDALFAASYAILPVFLLAMVLDMSTLRRMFFRVRSNSSVTLWVNWVLSFVFLISFVHLVSVQRSGLVLTPDDSISRYCFVAVALSFGYLLIFFAAIVLHDRTQRAMGRTFSRDTASLLFGVVFACVAVVWSVSPWRLSLSSLWHVVDYVVSSQAVVFSSGWACWAIAVAVFYNFKWGLPTGPTSSQVDLAKKRAATYPAPFPNAWYNLCLSKDVRRGEVKRVVALGQVFAVFRSEVDDKVSVIDAYCIHLGADLTVGGKVKNGNLECPFHRWQFGGDGKCAHIPYTDKIPAKASTRAWVTREYYGMICVYFHIEGKEPTYELDAYPGIDDGSFVHRGIYETDIAMHIQEFAENSVDFMHFDPLHGKMQVPWTAIPVPCVTIQHEAAWESDPDPSRGHVCYFHDHAQLKFNGKLMPRTAAKAVITFMGPASVVSFHFKIPDLGEIIMFQTHLPNEAMKQHVTFSWFAQKQIPRFLVWYVVGNWVAQWRNDLSVWENKIFLPRPILAPGDGPIAKLRRFYKQFYSDREYYDRLESTCNGREISCQPADALQW